MLAETNTPTTIINLAAYTNVNRAEIERDDAMRVNGLGAKFLAEISEQAGATLIHISTDYVFDGKTSRPYREDDPVKPLNVYGATKLAGERQIIEGCSRYRILRTSWVFSEFSTNFLTTITRKLIADREIQVVADQLGNPTYAGDLASVIYELASDLSNETQKFGVFHFCGSPAVSWYNFALEIRKELLLKGFDRVANVNPVTSNQFVSSVERPSYSCLDVSRIKSVFGIEPVCWSRGMEAAIFNFRAENF